MEVIAIGPHDRSSNPLLVDQMHRLRARVFKDRMGWDVTVVDGQEFDQFDDLNPASILVVDRGVVVGHTRVLPATGPTMLSETFGFLAPSGAFAPHSRMLETSRFCVDTSTARLTDDGIHLVTMTLIAGILEWADLGGYSEIVTVTDVRLERILRRVGLPLRRLGETSRIGNTIALAGIVDVDAQSSQQVRPSQYRSTFTKLTQAA
ncbi:acyl-homoserine-lactone synthase [Devosia neptuniae]|uniref:acyl-homoserine-lactone synthase n=1 Tax=Devosia neptuniae TaxID=191302 RepID=UPI0022AE8ED0|nr:acyl-homoserine-lactone synthase [Devosia neptuniae]MCZ4348089.1 GNAT family N-acetyltransferase [Devosia neptuniae]